MRVNLVCNGIKKMTENLKENDLMYRPSKDAYSTKETMLHIFTLSKTVYNTTLSKINERPDIDIPSDYESIRNVTLQFLEKASKNFSNLNSEELNQIRIKFNIPSASINRYSYINFLTIFYSCSFF